MPKGKPRTEEEIEKLLQTLEPVLKQGTSLDRACHYCNIPMRTIYDYIERHEWVRRRVDTARAFIDTVAENQIANAIHSGDISTAKWRLERALKSQYSLRQEMTDADGQAVFPVINIIKSEKNDGE